MHPFKAEISSKLSAIFFLDRIIVLRLRYLKIYEIVVVQQGCKADAALDAVNKMIDSMTKTIVFFLLQTSFLRRNVYRIVIL